MKRQLWQGVLLGAVFSALGSAQILTPPTCATLSTFQQVISAGGCDLGLGFTLKGASFGASTTGGEIGATQVNFSASFNSGIIGVGLSGPFNTTTGQNHTYTIRYVVDPPPDIISGFDSDVDFGSTTNALTTQAGSGSMNVALCSGATFTDTPPISAFCPSTFNTLVLNPSNPSAGVTFPLTYIVDVNLLLNLQNGGQMVSVFTQLPTTLVPEPAFGAAAGLLSAGMLLLRRRRR